MKQRILEYLDALGVAIVFDLFIVEHPQAHKAQILVKHPTRRNWLYI